MADRPILFSGPMVRALLDGKKTQTRRVLKPQPKGRFLGIVERPAGRRYWFGAGDGDVTSLEVKERFAVGDRLWVRETWTARMTHGWTIADARRRMFEEEILYAADEIHSIDGWWPSIHMPREFSRLTLTVTDVRVQKLQQITLGEICAEGLASSIYDFKPITAGFKAFCDLWDSLNAKRGCGWKTNPWVEAVSFTVDRLNIDAMAKEAVAA